MQEDELDGKRLHLTLAAPVVLHLPDRRMVAWEPVGPLVVEARIPLCVDCTRRFAGRDGIPDSGNLVAGNLLVTTAMVDAIGQQATPALLKA